MRVRSREMPHILESAFPTEINLLDATPEELKCEGNKPYEQDWLVRLPNCDNVRPSTIQGSDAAVRTIHNIEIHLSFLDKPFPMEKVKPCELDEFGRRLYHYRISWFVILPSCILRWRSFLLPAYTILDANPVPTTPREFLDCGKGGKFKYCTCGEDLDSLISYECEAEADLLTSAMMKEDIERFRALAAKHITTSQPISGGVGFVCDNLEGEVLEETDEERKRRLQREKEMNEFSAVEPGVGEVILYQEFRSQGQSENNWISCKA